MMTALLLNLMLVWQDNASDKLNIWEDITRMELFLKESVSNNDSLFSVSNSNPIHGYYVEKTGVFMVVPVRYRVNTARFNREMKDPSVPPVTAKKGVNKEDLKIRLKQWREQIAKENLRKDANFDQVVDNLKQIIPRLLEMANHLPNGESLILVIEESVPAWYSAHFPISRNPTRRVVSLVVDNDVFSKVQSDKVVLKSDWLKRVKENNTRRKLVVSD